MISIGLIRFLTSKRNMRHIEFIEVPHILNPMIQRVGGVEILIRTTEKKYKNTTEIVLALHCLRCIFKLVIKKKPFP